MLRLLKRAKADMKTLTTVYITCIRPILEYCNIPVIRSVAVSGISREITNYFKISVEKNFCLKTNFGRR